MAIFTGTGGKVTFNGKELAIANWELTPEQEPTRKALAMPSLAGMTLEATGALIPNRLSKFWYMLLIPCKITIPFFSRDFVFDGMCNPELTRVYLVSTVYPGKYFLKHLDFDTLTLRHERTTYDLDEASQWVLYAD